MKAINYGILGPGHIASAFCKALTREPNSRVYAIASRDSQRSADFAREFDAVKWYGDYDSLVADPNVDVIYIATPHSFHEQQALLCLRHKKPVVCEKPLTLSHASAQRIVQTARESKTFLMEGMWSRFNPAVCQAKAMIEEGVIGEVKYISADFGFAKPYDPSTRLYNMALAGGAILDVGVYPLSLALFILGEPASIQTTAHLAPTGADESCSIVLSYPEKVTAQLFCSMVVETKKEAVICGTKGVITIDTPWYKSMGLTLTKGMPGKDKEEKFLYPYPGNGFEFQIEEVNRCLSEGKTESPLLTLDFSLMKARVTDIILQQAGVVYPAI